MQEKGLECIPGQDTLCNFLHVLGSPGSRVSTSILRPAWYRGVIP
jgi:hypothetical protein